MPQTRMKSLEDHDHHRSIGNTVIYTKHSLDGLIGTERDRGGSYGAGPA
jgi:hypothetical protein